MSCGKVCSCDDLPILSIADELRDAGWERKGRLWELDLALLQDIPIEVKDWWEVIWRWIERQSGIAGADSD